jgi:gliding motility-associated-like protein
VIRNLGRRYTGWYKPHSGAGYLRLRTYDTGGPASPDPPREYAQGELRQPLRAGCTYRVSCWVRPTRTLEGVYDLTPVPCASDNLEIYFSGTRVGSSTVSQLLGLQPQVALLPPGQLLTDTLNYVYLSRTFVAQGGEQYFTLGNFQTNAATTVRKLRSNYVGPVPAYYAIDDVAVEAVPPAGLALELGPDLWLGACPGAGPATLTAPPGFQGYRWSTGAATASIQVSQPGHYGLVADYGCGELRDSVEVRRYDPRLTPLLPPVPALCPGQSVALAATPGFSDYRWADGPTGTARAVGQPGRYRLTARTADGCLVRDSVDVALLSPPAVPAGFPADTLVCAQEPWRLTLPLPPVGTTYEWSTGAAGPVLNVPAGAAGAYTLTARTRCQSVSATVRLRTQDCTALLLIPNVVTPNGNGQNDRFRVRAAGAHALRLQVFSRWGQLVFESAEYRDQWPATPQAAGLYYYLLTDDATGRRYRGWVEVRP